ncbi:MAG: hypothetical protein ACRCZ2_04300 [Fusobacteriaceae bacterium]
MIIFSERMLEMVSDVELDGGAYNTESDLVYAIAFDVDELFQVEYHQGFSIGTKYYNLGDCENLVDALNRCAEDGGVYEI